MNKIAFRKGLAGIILLMITCMGYGQIPSKIEHYSTEDGLSHDIISCMFKDHDGYMWFGTWDGINRFDGHNFKTYKSIPGDLSQLKNNRIDQITEGINNNLWIKSYDGQIYSFNKATEQFTSLGVQLKLKEKITFDRILSSDDGMLWVSTVNEGVIYLPNAGSNRGYFNWFKNDGGAGFKLPSNKLNFFYKDKAANFWIGTDSGIARISKNINGQYISESITLPDHKKYNYTSFTETHDKLYFGTATGVLISYEKSKRVFSTISKISDGKLNYLLAAKRQPKLYITTSKGQLILFDTQSTGIKRYSYDTNVDLKYIFEDNGGNLWLEPAKLGVVRFDKAKNGFKTYLQRTDAKFNNPNNHFKVYEDKNGIVWCIMRDGGFGYYDAAADKITYFYNEPGSRDRRFSNIVSVAFYDPAGVLWLHTDERGLEKVIFQPNNFKQHMLVYPGVFKSDNEVRGMLYDKQGRLWVGGKGGILYLYKNGQPVKNTFINMPTDGLGSVYAILQDSKNRIWLGTKAKGLYRADPTDASNSHYRLTHFEHNPLSTGSICSNEIYSLLEDKHGRIWIGSFDNGLDFYDCTNNSPTFIHASQIVKGYPHRFYKIRHMQLDKYGRLWLGTTDGLMVADVSDEGNFKFKTYSKKPGDSTSLGNNDIQYIYRDREDQMWLATSGGGLNLGITDGAKNIKFKSFTTRNGLANDYVLSITEDNAGHLWLATKSSLSYFDKFKQTFKNYNSYDGLPTTNFSEASCEKLNNGQLGFGTIHGYLSFDPGKIKDYPIHANIVFTNLQINNDDISINDYTGILDQNINNIKSIQLKYDQNIINIDYTVLDYRSGNRPSYMHRLIGSDTVWHDNKNQRRATYTNLQPGEYEFEVRCVDQERYLDTPSKKLAITILPPFWRTWWAYLIYLILVIIALEGVRRIIFTMLRLRQKISVERQLTELKLRFFTNMSHELRTPLTLILNPVEEIIKNEKLSEQGQEYFAIVKRNAGRMARFVNQLLDLRKVQSKKADLKVTLVEVVSFVHEIGEYFKEVAREKQITFKVKADSELVYAWLDADKMETVLYNLVSNSYKFTPAGREINVSITHNITLNTVGIEVADQGCGVLPDDLTHIFELYYEGGHPDNRNLKGSGIGLALAKELVDLHKGRMEAVNLPGGGFSVFVELPAGDLNTAEPPVLYQYLNAGTPLESAENMVSVLKTSMQNADMPILLLVEDNLDMRTFLARQLGSIYRVEIAENGLSGLKKAKDLQPDLILSDIMMPEMDGIEMLQQLKKDVLTSHIPVILLSAKSAIENQIKGLRYGADYYITKPFENDFLFAAVANLLEKRKRFAQSIVTDQSIIGLSPGEVSVTSKDEIFLKKVIAIVEERMADSDFNIDTVADLINMARATFFKKFKSLTQIAPVEFIRDMRLQRARQLFDAGAGNVTEISYQIGFINAKYFSTCFKAKYHISPSDYLKTIKPIKLINQDNLPDNTE